MMDKKINIALSKNAAVEIRSAILDLDSTEFSELLEALTIRLEAERVQEKLKPYFAESREFIGYYPPDGWAHIIEQCHDELVELDPNYRIVQVKEKFGGLRFYFNHGKEIAFDAVSEQAKETWDKINKIVDKYEALSYKVCENCGKPGEERNLRWVKTLCDKHYEEENE